MTNREVQLEVEERIAPYFPDFADTDEFRGEINSLVEMIKFEFDIPQGLAVNYLRQQITYYQNKMAPKKEEPKPKWIKPMIGEVRYTG